MKKTASSPAPISQPNSRRQNLSILLGLLAVFIVPFLWALYLYKNPDSSLLSAGQHGQLIVPAQSIQPLLNTTTLERKWRILLITTQVCDTHCEGMLNALHRLGHSMGEDRQRVERWLVSSNGVNWGRQDKDFTAYQLPTETIRQYVDTLPAAADGMIVKNRHYAIYLVDPRAQALMMYPVNVDLKWVRKDLRKLLRASRIG